MSVQLTIMTTNVRGLNIHEKRARLFAWLISTQADVFLLTETNCMSAELAAEWAREWATQGRHGAGNRTISRFAVVTGQGHSGGTAILVRPAAAHLFKQLSFSTPAALRGRVTRLRAEWGGSNYDVCAIYAPAKR